MFELGGKVQYDNCDYNVVLDHIVDSNLYENKDGSNFVSSKQKITNTLEVGFLNDYKVTDKQNPVGFYQTVLNNHSFDYSDNFKIQFEIKNNSYFISFDSQKGILIHDINSVIVNEFTLIEIDYDKFNNFQIIKTQSQIDRDLKQLRNKILFRHAYVYSAMLIGMWFYFLYQENNFDEENAKLSILNANVSYAQSSIGHIGYNATTLNIQPKQTHIKNLLQIFTGNNIFIQKANVDLTKFLATVVISLDDLEMVSHIAKNNNVKLNVDTDIVNNTANISWEVNK
jgi:hypothetical protein